MPFCNLFAVLVAKSAAVDADVVVVTGQAALARHAFAMAFCASGFLDRGEVAAKLIARGVERSVEVDELGAKDASIGC